MPQVFPAPAPPPWHSWQRHNGSDKWFDKLLMVTDTGRRTRPDPNIPRSRVDTAGHTLINKEGAPHLGSRDEALLIVGNWRAAHGWPLNAVKMALRNRVRKISPDAVLAQRLKRLTSIESKLRREGNMKLSQMHDIGGCRAVMKTVEEVERVVGLCESAEQVTELIKVYDYIASPKISGYRGVHLVYRYRSTSRANSVWNGLRIEVQIRSWHQHIWATALETVQTFTGQQLKAGAGEAQWLRFFALVGSAFAMQEGRPTVPGVPEDPRVLLSELRRLEKRLRVTELLSGWQAAIKKLGEKKARRADRFFLMVLDSDAKTIKITSYSRRDQVLASAEYLEVEERIENNPNLNAVLASAESILALPQAFPNYYLDTTAFRAAVLEIVHVGERALVSPLDSEVVRRAFLG